MGHKQIAERFRRDVPLAPFTTIGIGGPARYFVEVTTSDELEEALDWAATDHNSILILGGGSNLLISDNGFPGLVIRLRLRGVVVESEDAQVMVKAAAGEEWDPFVSMAVEKGWGGIECLSGIPGSIGATPIQNVGAYGQDVSETIIRVEALDRQSGIVRWLTNEECGFAYRDSIFKREARDRYVILSVTYRMERGGKASVRYPELERELSQRGTERTLAAVRDTVIAVRRRKGMVLDETDSDTRSDGSFFTNPIITAEQLEAFYARAQEHGIAEVNQIPLFPAGHRWKLSAAWLIERAGFHKGHVHGNVGISSKHTLAIINRGGGTAAEVLELVSAIQARVRESFGVHLVPEPNFVGF